MKTEFITLHRLSVKNGYIFDNSNKGLFAVEKFSKLL
jgi:hypothetical protein